MKLIVCRDIFVAIKIRDTFDLDDGEWNVVSVGAPLGGMRFDEIVVFRWGMSPSLIVQEQEDMWLNELTLKLSKDAMIKYIKTD